MSCAFRACGDPRCEVCTTTARGFPQPRLPLGAILVAQLAASERETATSVPQPTPGTGRMAPPRHERRQGRPSGRPGPRSSRGGPPEPETGNTNREPPLFSVG